MSDLIVTERPYRCKLRVYYGETWYDKLPQLVLPVLLTPYDVTNVVIELFIRPSLDHNTRFVKLTSIGSAGILKEDAVNGRIAIFYSHANVQANLPLTLTDEGWEHFMRLSFTDPELGAVEKLLWYGSCFVHPAKDAATA